MLVAVIPDQRGPDRLDGGMTAYIAVGGQCFAKAHQYYNAIRQGRTFEDIAASENLTKRRILQVIDLAFLAPDITKSVVQCDQPIGLTAKWLGLNAMPSDWQAQRRIIATL